MYPLMPSLAYMLESCNPVSIVAIETNEEDYFLYFFMSLAGFVQGWPHCCLVIVVNRTFIKVTYHKSLLSACAMDANE